MQAVPRAPKFSSSAIVGGAAGASATQWHTCVSQRPPWACTSLVQYTSPGLSVASSSTSVGVFSVANTHSPVRPMLVS